MSKNSDELRSKRDKRYKNPDLYGMTFREKTAYWAKQGRVKKKLRDLELDTLTINQIVSEIRSISKSMGSDTEVNIVLLKKGGGHFKKT